MDKKFRLTPDQFQLGTDGSLIINREEIAQAVQHTQEAEAFPPEEAKKIAIEVSN
jgi:hypothetical protein